MKKIFLLAFVAGFIFSCSSSDDPKPDDGGDNGGDNTELVAAENYFNDNLKSLISNKCISCHTGYHSSGSKNYGNFDSARNNAAGMHSRVESGSMPAGGPPLSDSEVALFKEFLNKVNAIN